VEEEQSREEGGCRRMAEEEVGTHDSAQGWVEVEALNLSPYLCYLSGKTWPVVPVAESLPQPPVAGWLVGELV